MDQIVVSHEKPPVLSDLERKFGADWDDGLIIAWDGKIHSKGKIWPQKVIHEKAHLVEQKRIGNEAWWKLYLDNDVFRLEQEAIAYKKEADFIKKNIKDREVRFQMIRDIAHSFSSELYGNIISPEEALRLLL